MCMRVRTKPLYTGGLCKALYSRGFAHTEGVFYAHTYSNFRLSSCIYTKPPIEEASWNPYAEKASWSPGGFAHTEGALQSPLHVHKEGFMTPLERFCGAFRGFMGTLQRSYMKGASQCSCVGFIRSLWVSCGLWKAPGASAGHSKSPRGFSWALWSPRAFCKASYLSYKQKIQPFST